MLFLCKGKGRKLTTKEEEFCSHFWRLSTHRHFLQVAVVVADRQAIELLLQLAHPLVVEVARWDEPVLVLLLQHLLEAALQELLLQQLLLHLEGNQRAGKTSQAKNSRALKVKGGIFITPVCCTPLRSPSTCTQRRGWHRCCLLRARWPPAPFPPCLELLHRGSWPPLDRSSQPALRVTAGELNKSVSYWFSPHRSSLASQTCSVRQTRPRVCGHEQKQTVQSRVSFPFTVLPEKLSKGEFPLLKPMGGFLAASVLRPTSN